jgi:cell division septation protein DedD
MVAEASGPRARRSRRRGDLIAPRALVHAVVAGAALALTGAFGAGWWLGQRGGLSAPERAPPRATPPSLTTDTPPVAPSAAAPAAPHATTSSAVARASLVASSSTGVSSASTAQASAVVVASRGAHAAPPPPTSAAVFAPAPPAVDVRTRAPSRGYGVQLGAFETEAEARDFVAAHADGLARLPVFLVPTTLEGRGTWHRVRAGDVKTRAAADTLRAALAPELAARAIVVSHK